MEAAAIDLSVLVERLRTAGFRVDTRQYLIAHELLLALAARGKPIDESAEKLASHLGPIFCTVPEEQQRFAAEVAAWRGSAAGAPPASVAALHPPFAFWRRWRQRIVAIALAVALLAGGVGSSLLYEYGEITLDGQVFTVARDGARSPARNAKVSFRDQPVALDSEARFQITTRRA